MNFNPRMSVARLTSGASPCVKNPVTPYVALKLVRRVGTEAPGFIMERPRTRSTGYIMAAVKKEEPRMAAVPAEGAASFPPRGKATVWVGEKVLEEEEEREEGGAAVRAGVNRREDA